VKREELAVFFYFFFFFFFFFFRFFFGPLNGPKPQKQNGWTPAASTALTGADPGIKPWNHRPRPARESKRANIAFFLRRAADDGEGPNRVGAVIHALDGEHGELVREAVVAEMIAKKAPRARACPDRDARRCKSRPRPWIGRRCGWQIMGCGGGRGCRRRPIR